MNMRNMTLKNIAGACGGDLHMSEGRKKILIQIELAQTGY